MKSNNEQLHSILGDREALQEAIQNSKTIADVLRYVGLSPMGRNYTTVRKYAEMYGLELPVYNPKDFNKELGFKNRKPNEDFFVENSTYKNGQEIKKASFRYGVGRQVC